MGYVCADASDYHDYFYNLPTSPGQSVHVRHGHGDGVCMYEPRNLLRDNLCEKKRTLKILDE